MGEMTVILRGLATSNEGDAYGLYFTASTWELILNKFTIYNRWYIRQKKTLPVAWLNEKLLLL